MKLTKITAGEVTYLVDFMNQLDEAEEIPEYIKEEAEQAKQLLEGLVTDVNRQEELDDEE